MDASRQAVAQAGLVRTRAGGARRRSSRARRATQAEAAVRTLIAYVGDNPDREGLLDTPKRVVGAYEELYRGYRECPAEVLDRTFSETGGYDDLVLVRDITLQLPLRAPHDAVHRQGACRLHAGGPGGRPVEARAPGRRLCAAPADAGAYDRADRDRDRRDPETARRRGDDRGRAHLHVAARRREGRRADGDDAVHRRVPRRSERAGALHHAGARRRSAKAPPRATREASGPTSPHLRRVETTDEDRRRPGLRAAIRRRRADHRLSSPTPRRATC